MSSKKLTPNQARFVEEYLIDLNATQAAIRAGYSEKTASQQGARLLANVKVAEAIQKSRKTRSERTKITQDWVLTEMVSQYNAANQRIKKLDMLGDPVVDENGAVVTVPIDQTSAVKVLDMLAKHTGTYEADKKLQLDGGLEIMWEDAKCKES